MGVSASKVGVAGFLVAAETTRSRVAVEQTTLNVITVPKQFAENSLN